ncbi:hypothetical protein HDU98_001119, partial [Podochytrium sp. JEL0797]
MAWQVYPAKLCMAGRLGRKIRVPEDELQTEIAYAADSQMDETWKDQHSYMRDGESRLARRL